MQESSFICGPVILKRGLREKLIWNEGYTAIMQSYSLVFPDAFQNDQTSCRFHPWPIIIMRLKTKIVFYSKQVVQFISLEKINTRSKKIMLTLPQPWVAEVIHETVCTRYTWSQSFRHAWGYKLFFWSYMLFLWDLSFYYHYSLILYVFPALQIGESAMHHRFYSFYFRYYFEMCKFCVCQLNLALGSISHLWIYFYWLRVFYCFAAKWFLSVKWLAQ